MKKLLNFLSISVVLSLAAIACGKGKSGGAGDPNMVAAVKEIVEKGCACKTKDCLFAIKVQDKSIMQWYGANQSKMTEDEKTATNANWRKYNECEAAAR